MDRSVDKEMGVEAIHEAKASIHLLANKGNHLKQMWSSASMRKRLAILVMISEVMRNPLEGN